MSVALRVVSMASNYASPPLQLERYTVHETEVGVESILRSKVFIIFTVAASPHRPPMCGVLGGVKCLGSDGRRPRNWSRCPSG